jgi:hypothetical protein
MIPAAFVWLPAFPLNASGKIDRKALPEPLAAPERTGTYLAPRTPFETLLAQIWQEALQVEMVGVDDNFFEMGGHSLLAGRVISLLQQITGRLLPLSALFAHPTVAQLAALLKEDSLLDQVWDTLVPIRKAGSRPPLYCIHPVSGDVEYAYKLIPYLPADQPVYGLLARGINGSGRAVPHGGGSRRGLRRTDHGAAARGAAAPGRLFVRRPGGLRNGPAPHRTRPQGGKPDPV